MPRYGDENQERLYWDIDVHTRKHGYLTVIRWVIEILSELLRDYVFSLIPEEQTE